MSRPYRFFAILAIVFAAAQTLPAADSGDAQNAATPAPRLSRTVAEGSLNAAGIAKMKAQANNLIAEGQFRAKTTLTPEDLKPFRESIMGVCLALFSEDLLPNGTRLQFVKYGVNVELKAVIDERFEKATLTPAEARILTRDFSRMLQLRAALAAEGLATNQRMALQAELNNLINKHFTVPAAPKPSTT